MNKRLTDTSIRSELAESAFFRTTEPPAAGSAPDAEFSVEDGHRQEKFPSRSESGNHDGVRTTDRPAGRATGCAENRPQIFPAESLRLLQEVERPIPEDRQPMRYSFQSWSDQIDRLKALNRAINLDRALGHRKPVTLSDMIRDDSPATTALIDGHPGA